jgi:hypothetical protein
MPGIESFGRSERELKRRLSEIEERVKQEQKPLGAIGLAIVQASTNARDQAKPMIKAPDEKERIQREIYIFYEFIYFFMHMTMRQAFAALTAARLEELQAYLGPLISSVAIDSYFAHWPEDRKQRMTGEFYEKLNDSELEYTESTQFETALEGDERMNAKLKALFMTLASNVADWAADNKDDIAVVAPVIKTAISEWKNMKLDALVADVAAKA